jgi:starch synthase
MATMTDRRIVAVATGNPLAVSTFSGLSRNLFTGLVDLGVDLAPIATRDIRPLDLLTGALNLSGLARGQVRGRRAPRINPNWYWSRAVAGRMSRRFDEKLVQLGAAFAKAPILQIGTHVITADRNRASYCVTDATVAQAVAADEFSVARAKAKVIEDALDYQREVFASCTRIFVLSEWAKQSVVTDYGIPDGRVVVLGAGANVSEELPRQIDTQHPYVLFVGADWEQKGGPLLLQAFRLVRERLPAVRLVIVGCSPRLSEPGVEIAGRLVRSDPEQARRLFALYAGASAFSIVPRFDAFPNVLLEAGWYGVPVVSTDEGSRSEAVVHGVTGLLASRRDPTELARHLVSLLTDPELAGRLGRQARLRVAESFTWSVVTRRLVDEIGLA